MSQFPNHHETSVQLFKKYVFSPFQSRPQIEHEDELQLIAMQIYNWARTNGAEYVSHFAHPQRSQIVQKQKTFLSLKMIKQNLIQSIGVQGLKLAHLWKEQIDGSSIPNGGLRQNHEGRTSLLWDHLSQLFIRKKHGILYIPSFIVTQEGNAIDDRLYFRIAQKKLEDSMTKLLKFFKIDFKGIFFGLGLEQEFFILPKDFVEKRLDLKYAKRALCGKTFIHSPVRSNYLKKMPDQVLTTLKQAQTQLLQLGVPIQTRHYEGAPNQFQLNSYMQHAGSAIDHNVLKMQILEEACQRNGLSVNYHEKPFSNVNGSGKHLNWSIQYFDMEEKLKNLYDLNYENEDLFLLMILVTLKAAQDHDKLYIASTCVPGNEIRMGKKQAPLPCMSIFLGQSVSNMVEGLSKPESKNLKDKIDLLCKNQKLVAQDRNRTSSYAYSHNRFEFRITGSSQNVTFPITVIMSTIMNEINIVLEKLNRGDKVKDIINNLREHTRKVRFDGNNYSKQWKEDAIKRGLYNPHKKFVDYIQDLEIYSKVLVDNSIYTYRQIQAKFRVMKQNYIDAVLVQKDCILKIINKNIIPRCYSFLSTFPRQLHLKSIQTRMRNFDKLLEQLVQKVQILQKMQVQVEEQQLDSAYNLRQYIFELSDLTDKILEYLPESDLFPQVYQHLNKWQNK